MSIYKFQDSEPVVTSTTTAALLAATDPVLVWSGNKNRTAQSVTGSVATLWPLTSATTNTTATALPNFGQSVISSSNTLVWSLTDPTAVGQMISLFSSSTSTSVVITTVSATIIATDTQTGISFTLSKPGAYFEAISRSTSVWAVTGRAAAGTACT